MPEPDQLPQQRRELAEALRDLRRASGLTSDRLAVRVGMSQSKISKIENGRIVPTPTDVERILTALGLPDPERGRIVELARTTSLLFTSWRVVRRSGLHRLQQTIAAIEQNAALIRCFQSVVVPGLLQTPEYARAVMSLPRIAGDSDPSDAVAMRARRQEVLYEPGRRFEFVITEAALRSMICPPPVMFTQIAHLAARSGLRNVEVAVLPWTARMREVASNAFVVFDDRLVTVETFHGEIQTRDPRDIALHAELFTSFHELSLRGRDARDFLVDLTEEYRLMDP